MEIDKVIIVTCAGNATGDNSKYQDCLDNYNQSMGQLTDWAKNNNRSLVTMTTSQAVIPLGNDNFMFTKTTQFLFQMRMGDFDAQGNKTYQQDYVVQ